MTARASNLLSEPATIHLVIGWISGLLIHGRSTNLSSYHFQMRGGKVRRGISMKAEDIVEDVFVCSTHSYLLFLTNTGRVYWLKALEIPDVGVSGRGKAIVNLLELQPGETMTSVVAVKDFSEDKYIVMLATNGQIKKTHLSEFRNVRRGGIIAMSLRPKSQLMWSRLTDGKREIIIATRLGKAIRFSEKDIRPMGRPAFEGYPWPRRTRSSGWCPSASGRNTSSRRARRGTASGPRWRHTGRHTAAERG